MNGQKNNAEFTFGGNSTPRRRRPRARCFIPRFCVPPFIPAPANVAFNISPVGTSNLSTSSYGQEVRQKAPFTPSNNSSGPRQNRGRSRAIIPRFYVPPIIPIPENVGGLIDSLKRSEETSAPPSSQELEQEIQAIRKATLVSGCTQTCCFNPLNVPVKDLTYTKIDGHVRLMNMHAKSVCPNHAKEIGSAAASDKPNQEIKKAPLAEVDLNKKLSGLNLTETKTSSDNELANYATNDKENAPTAPLVKKQENANPPAAKQEQKKPDEEPDQLEMPTENAQVSQGAKRGRRRRNRKVFCSFCSKNGQPYEVYSSHFCKNRRGIVMCPLLRNCICRFCGAFGDNAHTRKFCPFNRNGVGYYSPGNYRL